MIARRGRTTDPLLANISIAKMINQALGGPFVSPWDIGEMTEDFIDAVRVLYTDLKQMQTNLKKIDDIMAKWRAKHPTYRKRR